MPASRRPIRLLISAGPTREPIDPVRFLSNYSTGFVGVCLAREALRRGHRVTLVMGPTNYVPPATARTIQVERASEMDAALRRELPHTDVVIMAAAVSDFRPAKPLGRKLVRTRRLTLRLQATPDLVARLPRRPGQLFIGFCVETERLLEHARQKLSAKRLDLLVAQQANGAGSPFGEHPVHAVVLERSGRVLPLGRVGKPVLVRALLDKVESLWYGDPTPARDANHATPRAGNT